mgnify:CR=1 FL=1
MLTYTHSVKFHPVFTRRHTHTMQTDVFSASAPPPFFRAQARVVSVRDRPAGRREQVSAAFVGAVRGRAGALLHGRGRKCGARARCIHTYG